MASYEDLRQRHVADLIAVMPSLLERIEWPAERLAAHRHSELRRLVRVAKDLSPWHRKRLSDIDPDEVDESNLDQLPVMTKADLMANFDEIVTDDRLRLDVVEDYLDSLTGDAYLFDRYHACASGGSTGHRGVFVYDWDTWAVLYCSLKRYELRALLRDPVLAAAPRRGAAVFAHRATHISGAIGKTFAGGAPFELHRFPVTLPLDEIVAGLNETQPTTVSGYPSMLHLLAQEAREGRLRIEPLRILSGGEPLLAETRNALAEIWGAPVVNLWGSSEGVGHPSCGLGPWLHLSDDLTITEPVDVSGRPVASGVRSDKLFVTNLVNHAMPLIRYEITDQVRLIDGPCPCGSVYQRIEDPLGRLDDCFNYGDVTVHPHVFRSALSRQRHILEYQVRQTPGGADIAARCIGQVDFDGLAAEIAGDLGRLGMANPEVTVSPVDRLERLPSSGKLKRFVPLRTPLSGASAST